MERIESSIPILGTVLLVLMAGLLVYAQIRVKRRARLVGRCRELGRMFAAGREDEARHEFERVLSAAPGAAVFARCARALAESGAPTLALRAVGRARDLAPADAAVLEEAAQALLAAGEPGGALSLFSQVSVLRPDDADVRLEVARLAEGAGRSRFATRSLQRYLELRPGDSVVAEECARNLVAMGDAESAERILVAALAELRKKMERGDFWVLGDSAFREEYDRLTELYREVAGDRASAEKAVDGPAAAGLLDGGAGVNYRLTGYSILVDSTRRPRRIAVPRQQDLKEVADRLLATGPDRPEGHEDLGLYWLREGKSAEARVEFERAVVLDDQAWPAYVGLGAAMDAWKHPPRRKLAHVLERVEESSGLEPLAPAWRSLTEYERKYFALCVAPAAWAVPKILGEGGRTHILSLDARVTDIDLFRSVRGAIHNEDQRRYDAIGGIAEGPTSATKIEELYTTHPLGGWTLAHEFGHQVHAVLGFLECEEIRKLLDRFRSAGYLGDAYGLTNEFEFFACGYERYAIRQALSSSPLDELHEADVEFGLDRFFRSLG